MSRRNHKIIAETDEIGTEKTTSNKNETKSWFFKKICKGDKYLARLTKKEWREIQIKSEMKEELL